MAGRKSQKTPHVLIIGGGFAGTAAARKLADEGGVNITLISDKSYFEYYPAFYRVVTGAGPIEVCVPLSDLLPPEVDIIVDKIVSFNLKEKEAVGEKGHIYRADYIVIAIGSETSYFNLPGLPEHSFGFKSIGEAVRLKEHIRDLFLDKRVSTKIAGKKAGTADLVKNIDPGVARDAQKDMVSRFQVVIVGGGPSGVEVAGDLTEYMESLAKKYKVDPSFVTIDIIERGNRLIGATHPKASAAAETRLRNLGVNIFLNREVMAEEVEKILMGDMELKTKTVIWTAGTTINQLFRKTVGLQFTERRRVLVDDYLQPVTSAGSREDVYIAGDGAGTKYSGLAQTAIRDGNFVARDIIRKTRKRDRAKYKSRGIDYIIPIGRNWALMSFGKVHVFGSFAHLCRQLVDFFYFAKILTPKKTLDLFWKGKKYR